MPSKLIIFMIISFLWVNKLKAQDYSYLEINEVMELYADGQYDIVRAKLGNYGFVVTKSTPDYTLNGVTHTGDFVMMREKESNSMLWRSANGRSISVNDTDRWFFSTVNYPSLLKEYSTQRTVDIKFDLTERGISSVFNYFCVLDQSQIDTTYNMCQANHQCRMLRNKTISRGHNPIVDSGQQEITTYSNLNLNLMNNDETLNGFLVRHCYYRNLTVAKPNPTTKEASPYNKKR